MLLPYDIFTNIIPFSDMKTIFNLYHTDRKLRELCLNDKFGNILIKTSNNKYFNLDVKSELLDKFLNDITNAEMLNKLQLKLATSLTNRLAIIVINSIEDDVKDIQSNEIYENKIILYGFNNGKSTLVDLLRKLNLKINRYYEEDDGDKLIHMDTGNTIDYKYIFKSNSPAVKFKFNNNFKHIVDMRNLLRSDKNVLSSLLNFLLDGYRKSLI
jgi:hypothetical protein